MPTTPPKKLQKHSNWVSWVTRNTKYFELGLTIDTRDVGECIVTLQAKLINNSDIKDVTMKLRLFCGGLRYSSRGGMAPIKSPKRTNC